MLQETFISVFFSPHVREFKAVLDSGFHAMDSGFYSLLAQDAGLRIPQAKRNFSLGPYLSLSMFRKRKRQFLWLCLPIP